jgi:alpha-tubulin suppressor-like RCC1 family protein
MAWEGAMAGTVSSWGDNSNGQLGDGTTAGRDTPHEVKGLDGVIALEAGSGHVLAVREDGTVWGWGRNVFGQLGDGTTENRTSPVQARGLTGVRAVAPGGGHSLALKDDGTVWGWGAGFFGMLAGITGGVQPVPARIEGLQDVVAVAAGGSHNLALLVDGQVVTWGRDDHGQLGDGDVPDLPGRRIVEYRGASFNCRFAPAAVRGLGDVRALTTGGGHSLVLHGNATISTWGYNDRGQLGDGGTADCAHPRRVDGLTGVRALAAGYHHSLALLDAAVMAWGLNDGGQVGDGSTTHRSRPVPVNGLVRPVAVAASGGGSDVDPGNGGHSLAVLSDGTVMAWGYNDFGQLGDGSRHNQLVPVPVLGLAGVRRVTAGGEIPQFRENPGGGYTLALH